jgi:tRNA threonylcarbamoyladenosine biosynthesis protein TsaB
VIVLAAWRRREQPSLTAVQESTSSKAVLGIDTATADTVVAVARDRDVVWEGREGPQGSERPRHAATLLAEVERAVAAAGGWEAIGLIAVGVGPGTFTGLRIGVASARALAQARDLGLVPVSSLAALARGIPGAEGQPRLPLIDARRGELFAALHEPDGTAVWEPFVASPETIAGRLAALDRTPLAAGDGSIRFREQLEAAGARVLPSADPAHRIAARHICELADRAGKRGLEQVKPIYLRRPDAELWRER